MNVRVAIGALLPDIRKDRLGMTLRAGHRLVQAAQGEARCIVIKFWNRADRLPAIERMAVLARHR